MKRKITLLGRGGTVLIAISLALILVSLIPPNAQRLSGGLLPVSSERVHFIPIQVLTPQYGLQLSITAQDTLDIYMLEAYYWELVVEIGNVTNTTTSGLEEFLEANPNLILWHHQINDESYDRNYVPPKVVNATLVLSTPSSDNINIEYQVELTTTIGPADKIRNIAIWTTPIGLILTLPWLASLWKQRKQP